MGKTTFLETIRRNLADNKMIRLARAHGTRRSCSVPIT